MSRSVIHNIGDVVAEKYRITGVLGQGGVGVTYEAERVDGDVVALKVVSLRNMKGWKVCCCQHSTKFIFFMVKRCVAQYTLCACQFRAFYPWTPKFLSAMCHVVIG